MAGRRRESFAEKRERRAAIEDPAVVLDAAARFLEARQRSVAEVRRRLTQAAYQADLIDGAIARLIEIGVLDDETFARSWVESRDRARPRGGAVLKRELRLKGIAVETIEAVLTERNETDAAANGPTPDETGAARLLARRGRALERVADPRARRQRAYALLVRNGFDSETSQRAVTAWLAAGVAAAED